MAQLLFRPVRGRKTQGFGENPLPYQPAGHLADDYAANLGESVLSAAAGIVVYAGPGENMPHDIAVKYGYVYGPGGADSGIIVIVDHLDGSFTAYSHNSGVAVGTGQYVGAGECIAYAGSTGRSTGVHVHMEYATLPVNYNDPRYSRTDPENQYSARPLLWDGIDGIYADE